MSWAAVAGKEFRDAIRSRRIWLITAAFVILFNVPLLLWEYLGFVPATPSVTPDTSITSAYAKSLMSINQVFVPLIAIVSGYRMVVGELESGSMKLLLSLPHSRHDVFIGKILGRTGVVGVAISTAFLPSYVILYATGKPVDLILFTISGMLTIFFGLAFFTLAAGLSAATTSPLKSGAMSFGIFIWFSEFWLPITTLARLLSESYGLKSREFFEFWHMLKTISPVEAYRDLTFVLRNEPQDSIVHSAYHNAGWDWPPFYMTNEWHLTVLVVWAAVPAIIGYYLFKRRDL